MKFKVGDIVRLDCGSIGTIHEIGRTTPYETAKIDCFSGFDAGLQVRRRLNDITLPPIYERDGKRFIPSSEAKIPDVGEWYLSGKNNNAVQRKADVYCHHPRVILLPVPEVEPEVDPFLDGTREITDVDLVKCLTVKKLLEVRCRAECCKKKLSCAGGSVSFHAALRGYMAFYHPGNDTPFAVVYSSEMSWKVEWLIPKEDIRVVEKPVMSDKEFEELKASTGL